MSLWLLVENRDRWEPDIADTPFPEPVRAKLSRTAARPGVRMQLIRGERSDGPLRFFVVLTAPIMAVYGFELDDYRQLANIDLEAILAGEVGARRLHSPLYLVCTHGRRDRCCARYGVAFYRHLREAQPRAEVWQSSHQGGHRFAATALFLPHGLHYGRLDPDEAADMVEAHHRGQLYDLKRYRGQTRYPRPVQAAEGWLREQENVLTLRGPELVDHVTLDDDHHAVRFRTPDSKMHRLTLAPRRGGVARLASCRAETPETPRWYYVVRHEAQTAEVARLAGEA